MKCPNCESESTCVVVTRKVKGISVAFRDRYCKNCLKVFRTVEVPEDHQPFQNCTCQE
jgi:transcriptional regulator NrdR family protein